jgi:hypothetical protein
MSSSRLAASTLAYALNEDYDNKTINLADGYLGAYYEERCKLLLVNQRLDVLLQKVWSCFRGLFDLLVHCDTDCKESQSDPDFIKDGVCFLFDCLTIIS